MISMVGFVASLLLRYNFPNYSFFSNYFGNIWNRRLILFIKMLYHCAVLLSLLGKRPALVLTSYLPFQRLFPRRNFNELLTVATWPVRPFLHYL